MKRLLLATSLATLVCAVPATAWADGFFTPFAGVTFSGDAPLRKLSMGAAISSTGKVAGFEIEFGYTPDFFGEQRGTALIADSNITTLMGNVTLGPGIGPIRLYVAGGAGLLRARVDTSGFFSNVTASDFGLDAGGGVVVLITPHVGIRGDLRYFRRLTDPSADNDLDLSLGDLHYWRAVAGLTFKF